MPVPKFTQEYVRGVFEVCDFLHNMHKVGAKVGGRLSLSLVLRHPLMFFFKTRYISAGLSTLPKLHAFAGFFWPL